MVATRSSEPGRKGPGILALVGPTGVGKSAVAMEISRRWKGEIVSVDSMQVYRGLDIGTDKPDQAARNEVRHHLIDVVEMTESFDAARFVEMARRAIDDVRQRGAVPVLCGGTGFYLKALMEGLDQIPAPDPALRRELESLPSRELLRELQERDPQSLTRLDPHNRRRLVRAVEITRLRADRNLIPRGGRVLGLAESVPVFGLRRDPGDLRRRIDERVRRMFERGLVEETKKLLVQGLGRNRTAMQALGYRQVVEHLQGERSLAQTVQQVQLKTWQYARRQMTWFRNQFEVHWIEVDQGERPDAIVDRLLERTPSLRSLEQGSQ